MSTFRPLMVYAWLHVHIHLPIRAPYHYETWKAARLSWPSAYWRWVPEDTGLCELIFADLMMCRVVMNLSLFAAVLERSAFFSLTILLIDKWVETCRIGLHQITSRAGNYVETYSIQTDRFVISSLRQLPKNMFSVYFCICLWMTLERRYRARPVSARGTFFSIVNLHFSNWRNLKLLKDCSLGATERPISA